MNQITNKKVQKEEFNIKKVLYPYLRHVHWIILFPLLFFAYSYFDLSDKHNIYVSEAKVMVMDNKSSGLKSELDVFSDIGIATPKTNVHNEIEALKTRTLLREVVKDLGLQESLRKIEGIMKPDRLFYKNKPIYTQLTSVEKMAIPYTIEFKLNIINPERFVLYQIKYDDGSSYEQLIGTFNFNENINSPIGELSFLTNQDTYQLKEGDEFILSFTPVGSIVNQIKGNLDIFLLNQNVSILSVQHKSPIKALNNDVINSLIEQHEKRVIFQKNKIAVRTSQFISERMERIEKELSNVEDLSENFKIENNLINPEAKATELISKESELDMRIREATIQLSIAEFMYEFILNAENEYNLIPTNIGVEDGSLSTVIENYNALILERNQLARGSSDKIPQVVQLDEQIEEMYNNLKNSFEKFFTRLRLQLIALEETEQEYNQKLAQVPGFERDYRVIQRQQEIKESLYVYLLQKREENEIAMASTLGNVSLLEKAYAFGSPVGPDKKGDYIQSILIGLFIPIGFIFLRKRLDTKIKNAEDIEKIGIPYLGEIPDFKGQEQVVVVKGGHSPAGEALRMLRVNMNFMIPRSAKKSKTIFITSTISGEGKTFTAINLASSIALTDKKVVLLSLDLRKPKVSRYLGIKDGIGVTEYVVDDSIALDSIIQTLSQNKNLDIILSGAIPPNPSELLTTQKVDDLFKSLEERYDYIIVDTAPVGLVSDVLTIVNKADLLLYVIRYGKLEKEALQIPKKLSEENQVKSMATILNGTKLSRTGYGYGYSYGYGYGYSNEDEIKKPWYKVW